MEVAGTYSGGGDGRPDGVAAAAGTTAIPSAAGMPELAIAGPPGGPGPAGRGSGSSGPAPAEEPVLSPAAYNSTWAVPNPGRSGRGSVDYLVAGPAKTADPERLWQEARRLRAQGASAVVMAEAATEDEALAAARRLGCLRLLWLDGRRRVLRMAWPPGR